MLTLKVIVINTNEFSMESLLSSSFLSESDIKGLERFKLEITKKEKAASLILKNKYVGKYHYNEFGKPVSDSCYFNISHSSGVVVFVKDEVPVGIDIEKIRPVKDELISYISSNEEKEYIKDDKSFFEAWTNKESLTKCIGIGLKTKIKEIPALPIEGVREYQNKLFYCRSIVINNYVISINREDVEPFEIDTENF